MLDFVIRRRIFSQKVRYLENRYKDFCKIISSINTTTFEKRNVKIIVGVFGAFLKVEVNLDANGFRRMINDNTIIRDVLNEINSRFNINFTGNL